MQAFAAQQNKLAIAIAVRSFGLSITKQQVEASVFSKIRRAGQFCASFRGDPTEHSTARVRMCGCQTEKSGIPREASGCTILFLSLSIGMQAFADQQLRFAIAMLLKSFGLSITKHRLVGNSDAE